MSENNSPNSNIQQKDGEKQKIDEQTTDKKVEEKKNDESKNEEKKTPNAPEKTETLNDVVRSYTQIEDTHKQITSLVSSMKDVCDTNLILYSMTGNSSELDLTSNITLDEKNLNDAQKKKIDEIAKKVADENKGTDYAFTATRNKSGKITLPYYALVKIANSCATECERNDTQQILNSLSNSITKSRVSRNRPKRIISIFMMILGLGSTILSVVGLTVGTIPILTYAGFGIAGLSAAYLAYTRIANLLKGSKYYGQQDKIDKLTEECKESTQKIKEKNGKSINEMGDKKATPQTPTPEQQKTNNPTQSQNPPINQPPVIDPSSTNPSIVPPAPINLNNVNNGKDKVGENKDKKEENNMPLEVLGKDKNNNDKNKDDSNEKEEEKNNEIDKEPTDVNNNYIDNKLSIEPDNKKDNDNKKKDSEQNQPNVNKVSEDLMENSQNNNNNQNKDSNNNKPGNNKLEENKKKKILKNPINNIKTIDNNKNKSDNPSPIGNEKNNNKKKQIDISPYKERSKSVNEIPKLTNLNGMCKEKEEIRHS